jgi:hypothetical protein
MERSDNYRFSEIDLIRLLEQIAERDPTIESWATGPRASDHGRVDLILERNGTILVVEVKRVAPQTRERLQDMLEQIGRYKAAIAKQFPRHPVQLVLVIPGVLTTDRMEAVTAAGVELWDQRWIVNKAGQFALEDEVERLFGGGLYDEPADLPIADLLQARLG